MIRWNHHWGLTLCRRILSGDDNKAMTKVTMEFNISNGCSLNGIASGCPMNFGLARKNTGAPSLQFWLFRCIFLHFKKPYFPLSSIAYFSVSKSFMCSTGAGAALIRIYLVSVGGSEWISHHLYHHHHHLQQRHLHHLHHHLQQRHLHHNHHLLQRHLHHLHHHLHHHHPYQLQWGEGENCAISGLLSQE